MASIVPKPENPAAARTRQHSAGSLKRKKGGAGGKSTFKVPCAAIAA